MIKNDESHHFEYFTPPVFFLLLLLLTLDVFECMLRIITDIITELSNQEYENSGLYMYMINVPLIMNKMGNFVISHRFFFSFFLSVAAPRIAFLLTCLHRLSIINTAMLHRCRRGLITPICSVIS